MVNKRTRGNRVVVPVAVPTKKGGTQAKVKALNPKQRAILQEATNRDIRARLHSLPQKQQEAFHQLRDIPAILGDDSNFEDDMYTHEEVANGNVRVEISHAGGEMAELRDGLESDLRKNSRRPDTRDRRDTIQRRTLAFRAQLKAMTDAYIKWGAAQTQLGAEGMPPMPIEPGAKIHTVEVMDLLSTSLPLYLSHTLLIMFLGSYSTKFTLTSDDRVERILGRDSEYWRLKNCCPACTYKLEGEMKLIFEMLVTMDGNDSLKRVLTREKGGKEKGRSERPDPRAAEGGGNYYITREKVDKWAKEVLAKLVKKPRKAKEDADSECQERWKNMSEDLTAKMWGVFDETGIFLALCRHGFVLLVADMVRSGELAKYGLAVTNALMEAFGEDLGIGYDIGCGFRITISQSPLGEKAKKLNLKTLVGAFHGHAHNRLCQLKNLATYVPGMGLEDLEGCERFFSKSNALARSVRYASVFHRRQAISTYLAHTDTFETYAHLSTFLVNNYKQALQIIDLEASLKFAMAQAGVTGYEEFEERLKQEEAYLRGLIKEPEEETDTMEYYRRLVNQDEKWQHYKEVHSKTSTAKARVKRHAKENWQKAMAMVQDMEQKMGIEDRWFWMDEEYKKAAELVVTRTYRLAVNRLEELVVRRLFELAKMNMSGTGYKLRKHIAKALQTRSKTIRAALARYNEAALALTPPRRRLEWEEVIEFGFLSYFDILRDVQGNAAIRPWATPAARQLMDTYFKIKRAREEIDRLNVEIRRLVTYIRDEKEFLVKKEEEVKKTDPDLAFFVRQYRMRRGRFDELHMAKLQELKKELRGRFTGTLEPGVRRKEEVQVREGEMEVDSEEEEDEEEMPSEWETDDEDEEREEEHIAQVMERVMVFATDDGVLEEE
ncbi:hypothetical protein R3P38DRAFT_2532722 [Favolaschia claudopus]|uniref:Clu domain-containing protein n=1 Tax=Favolaschia claudopus TaxID=2862362 RepID=A0AAW0BBD8_9AGAR